MKMNKNIFICAFLVVMMLVCVSAVSAEDNLNANLGADASDAADLSVSNVKESETLSDADEGSSSGEILATDVVTNSTFFNYFDENGVINKSISAKELTFDGNFSGLGIDTITIDTPIVITCENDTVFYNIGFKILSDKVTLNGFDIVRTIDGAAIDIKASDVTVDDVFIDIESVGNKDSFAIRAIESDNLKLLNNIITYVAGYNATNTAVYQHVIEVRASNNATLKKNHVEAGLPTITAVWTAVGINKDYPLAIGVQDCNNFTFTENHVHAYVNTVNAYQTLDAMMVDNVTGLVITDNYFTEFAQTEPNVVLYLYAVDLYNSKGIVISGNGILVNTTSGNIDEGAAYPIQITGPVTDFIIDDNMLVTFSKGNNLGIYAQDWAGSVEGYITNNRIGVMGKVSDGQWGLLSGIEMSASDVYIIGNEIIVVNNNTYADANKVYGISYAQAHDDVSHNLTIADNIVQSKGKYAVYLEKSNATVAVNTLYGHDLLGDDAAFVVGGSSVVENNCPPFVITNATFYSFFDEDNYLAKHIPEGATLDFQGVFIGNISQYSAFINKPVNIISSTGDAVFEYATDLGNSDLNKVNCIQLKVVAGGDNTNITGITILNGDLFVEGASGVNIDKITVKANMSGIGKSTGLVAIHSGSYNTTVTNSYFENGGTGSSLLVLGNGGKYASFDHNIFNVTGSSGNVVSSNIFVGTGEKPGTVNYTNNIIYNAMPEAGTMYAMTVSSDNNLVENNTIYNFKGNGIVPQFSTTTSHNIYRNNTITGGASLSAGTFSIIENNNIDGAMTITEGCTATGNTAKTATISGKNAVVDNNTFFGVSNNGAVYISSSSAKNTTFTNNYLKDALTVSSSDNVITGNKISTEKAYAVDLKSTSGNTVTKNVLSSADKMGDEAVKYVEDKDNVVKYNGLNAIIEIDVADSWSGYNNTINVTVVEASGNITIRVNGKEFEPITLDKYGKATFEIPANVIEVGLNDLTVDYSGDDIINPETKSVTFHGLDNVITSEIFFNYFDKEGFLKADVPYDDLVFKGAFAKSKTVQYIIIDRPVFISSDAASFSLMGLVIASDNVTVDGLKLTTTVNSATSALGDLITVGGNNVTLTNLDITYKVTRGDYDAIAIDAFGVNNITIANNTIVFESTVSDDEYSANAINLDGVNYALVYNNTITTKLPGLYASNYDWNYYMMGLNTVNPVRIRNSTNINFTYNSIDSGVKSVYSFPTVQCLYVVGVTNASFAYNNFTMVDTYSKAGDTIYLYAINFGYDKNTFVMKNNFNLYTKAGKDSTGAAYAMQIVNSQLYIIGNNITTESSGPNLGIYVAIPMAAEPKTKLYILNNNIDVTGYASSKNTDALVSGIEVQDGEAAIVFNRINVVNNAGYVKNAPVYGVSYAQWGYGCSLGIGYNFINVNGDYAVSVKTGNSADVVENVLFAEKLYGDRAANVDMSMSVVENNTPMNPYLLVEFDDITVGETAVFNITFDANNTGEVTLIVNGRAYDVNVTNGTGQVNVSGLEANQYTVIAYLTEVAPYGPDEFEAVLTVAKYPTDIIIDVADVKAGKDAKVTFDLGNARGNVIAIIDGKKQVLRINYKGIATATIKQIDAGEHSIVAIYEGDANNEYAYNFTSFTINKTDTPISVNVTPAKVGEITTITVDVPDAASGLVLVTVDEFIYGIDLNMGKSVNITFLESGVYNVSAIYLGDAYYEANASDVISVEIVDKSPSNITVEIPKDVKVGDEVVLNVTADNPDLIAMLEETPIEIVNGTIRFTPDKEGTYIFSIFASENEDYKQEIAVAVVDVYKYESSVEIKLPENITVGKEMEITILCDTDAEVVVTIDGQAVDIIGDKVTFIPTAGIHTIIAFADETNKYTAAVDDVSFEVLKLDSEVTVNVTDAKVNEKVTITVNVTEGASGIVIIAVGDDAYSIDLDEGNVLEIVGYVAGTYNVTAYYMGDDVYYSNSSDVATLNIIAKTLSYINAEIPENIKVGDEVVINITHDNPDIAVMVNSEPVEIVNGTITVIPLEEGGYLLEIYAFENENYTEAYGNAVFDVTKREASVEIKLPENITIGEEMNISIVYNSDAEVVVLIDGIEREVVNGTVTIFNLEGAHDIVAYVNETDVFTAAIAFDSYNVNKKEATVEINATNVFVGQKSTITVTIPEGAVGVVIVTVDDEQFYAIEYLHENTGSVDVVFDEAGNHIVYATYLGDLTYDPANSNDITVVVSAKEVTEANITVPADIKVGEKANVTVDVPGATGYVSVIVDGNETIAPLINGSASVPIDATAGDHNVVVIYSGDEAHEAVYDSKTFSVPKETSQANVTIGDIAIGKDTNVSVSIPGATGNVSVIVDGKENIVPLDENGSAVVPVSGLAAGDHSVVVVYSGDDTHDAAYVAKEIKQTALDSKFTNITVSGDGTVSAILKDSTGKAIANAPVTYTINGVANSTVSGADGLVTIKAASNTEVVIAYAGTDEILPVDVAITIKDIAPVRMATQVLGNNYTQPAIEYYLGERGGNFTVQLVDQNGKPLANKTVYIGYNGKMLNRTTDENGFARVQINLVAENRLTFAVAFLGDDNYNATMSVYLITITKKAVTISAPSKSYKASDKTKSYTVTLKTDANPFDGKTYFGAGKKVTLKLNGKTYTAKTNDKGQATFKLDITKKGTFSADISYAGDNTYKSAKTTAKIKIN